MAPLGVTTRSMEFGEKMNNVWPKQPPQLTQAQQIAREQFMLAWHQTLPSRYAVIEKFNHQSVAELPLKRNARTLEVGAGIGGHLPFEDLSRQDYYALEYRPEFCHILKEKLPASQVSCGDIQLKTSFPTGYFDRVIAIHVLEHLCALPAALEEVSRLLALDGVFDVVIPCEGGLSYSLARRISAQRFFERQFKMSYAPIIANEHVNNASEILALLSKYFRIASSLYFPLRVKSTTFNLCIRLRLRKF